MSSLRWRLILAFALLTVSVLMITDVVVYLSVAQERSNRLRHDVSQEAHAAAVIFASTGALTPGSTVNDAAAPARLRAGIAQGTSGTQIGRNGGAPVMWGAASVGGFASGDGSGVYVQESAEPDERALAALRISLLAASLAILLVALAVGAAISTGLVRRLVRAAEVSRRIADGDLDARIHSSGNDEVAALSRVVDQMADSVQARIGRERRFTADAAHELRTPVTGLVAAAYLLPSDDPSADLVRREADRLRRLVEDLLEISRLEAGDQRAERQRVDLRALTSDIIRAYPAGICVHGTGTAHTDPRRLERIISNLLDNALRHGGPPVQISVSDTAIAVTDRGAGFPVTELPRLTERFVTFGNGTGLGLAIVAEQARILGATLLLENPVEGGARAQLSWDAEAESADPDAAPVNAVER